MELSKEIIVYMRYMHGAFNTLVALMVFSQFALGLRLMKARKHGSSDPQRSRRHRRLGPLVVAAGLLGFTAGTTLIVLDKGRVLVYPFHFATGALIALMLLSAFLLSKKISPESARVRILHGRVGIAIAALYLAQVILGLGVLL